MGRVGKKAAALEPPSPLQKRAHGLRQFQELRPPELTRRVFEERNTHDRTEDSLGPTERVRPREEKAEPKREPTLARKLDRRPSVEARAFE